MKDTLRRYADKLPYIRNLRDQVNRQGQYRAGHYYSPIPSESDVLTYLASRDPLPTELPEIALNADAQLALLQAYVPFYADLQFPENPHPDFRYYYSPFWFGYADAFFLSSFLRTHTPRRIIEIGSGFSSAVILDTVDRYFQDPPSITFVEPNSGRLNDLLRPGDRERTTIVPFRIQDLSLDLFDSLGPGDLLLIDSSHVVKVNSDVFILMFEVIPNLPDGIFIHFHDVFYPFDYPQKWLRSGTYWNEAYVLRAFLAYNSAWRIHLFSSFVDRMFGDLLRREMPLCANNPGSSLYLQKSQNGTGASAGR